MQNIFKNSTSIRYLLILALILGFNYGAFAQGYFTIGNGTSGDHKSPMDRNKNYSTSETIYLQSEIGSGSFYFTKLAYYKESGSNQQGIQNVKIYMKHTTDETLDNGSFSLNGYIKVFEGTFTNNAENGWMEVTLDNGFLYNGTDHLRVLVVKGYQDHIAHKPKWRYTHLSEYLSRDNSDNSSQPTNLQRTKKRPNIRLEYGTPTHVINNGNGKANKYDLSQNYPNPFNPVTRIEYSLPYQAKVSLIITDITGKEITTLVNESQIAGSHIVQFDASNLTSGAYFYRIVMDDGQNSYKMTKKMLLIK